MTPGRHERSVTSSLPASACSLASARSEAMRRLSQVDATGFLPLCGVYPIRCDESRDFGVIQTRGWSKTTRNEK